MHTTNNKREGNERRRVVSVLPWLVRDSGKNRSKRGGDRWNGPSLLEPVGDRGRSGTPKRVVKMPPKPSKPPKSIDGKLHVPSDRTHGTEAQL